LVQRKEAVPSVRRRTERALKRAEPRAARLVAFLSGNRKEMTMSRLILVIAGIGGLLAGCVNVDRSYGGYARGGYYYGTSSSGYYSTGPYNYVPRSPNPGGAYAG
jgi:hypothetical protein